jgi:hypothetical protein
MTICKKCQGFIVIRTLTKDNDARIARLRSDYSLAIKHYKEYKDKYKKIVAEQGEKIEEIEELFNVTYNGICCEIDKEMSDNG